MNLAGMDFYRWHVIKRDSGERWLCQCQCGTTRTVIGSSLNRGHSKSCGCLNNERSAARAVTRNKSKAMRQAVSRYRTSHGQTRQGKITPEYHSWKAMHDRCYYPSHSAFMRYGGRGIQVCLRWHRSTTNALENFISDMGKRPVGKSLDRINNDWGYMPSNCRWATALEQAMNKRKRKEQEERTGGVNDFIEEEQQFSNYEGWEL